MVSIPLGHIFSPYMAFFGQLLLAPGRGVLPSRALMLLDLTSWRVVGVGWRGSPFRRSGVFALSFSLLLLLTVVTAGPFQMVMRAGGWLLASRVRVWGS